MRIIFIVLLSIVISSCVKIDVSNDIFTYDSTEQRFTNHSKESIDIYVGKIGGGLDSALTPLFVHTLESGKCISMYGDVAVVSTGSEDYLVHMTRGGVPMQTRHMASLKGMCAANYMDQKKGIGSIYIWETGERMLEGGNRNQGSRAKGMGSDSWI